MTEPEPYVVPEGWVIDGLGHCRSCGAPIAWAITPKGKRAPINRDGVTHFATCPEARAWRRRDPVKPADVAPETEAELRAAHGDR